MYVRHDLFVNVRLDLDEIEQLAFDYNYCRIANQYETAGTVSQETPPIYYFINNKRQISSKCIELELELDVVNTLGQEKNPLLSYGAGNPRNFLKETKIARQHKDRFVKPTSFNPALANNVLYRKIDRISEEVVPNKLLKTDTVLRSDLDLDFYLIYKGSTAIETYLVANEALQVGVSMDPNPLTLTASDLEEGKYYYFTDIDNPGGETQIDWSGLTYDAVLGTNYNVCVAYSPGTPPTLTPGSKKLRGIVLTKNTGTMYVSFMYDSPSIYLNGGQKFEISVPTWPNYVNLTSITADLDNFHRASSITFFNNAYFMRVATSNYPNQLPEGIKELTNTQYGLYIGVDSYKITNTIEDVDRTDSTLVKIIKYPYCPIPFTYDEDLDLWDFGSDWSYRAGLIKFMGNNVPILGNTSVVSQNLDSYLKYNFTSAITANDTINKDLESKMHHSDFEGVKINYDSFNQPIYLENIEPTIDGNSKILNIDFKPTSTVNSKFAFKLDFSDVGAYNSNIDYDKYLLVTRNNEEIILNSEYMNYIKVGYNYDKKAQALQIENAQKNAASTTFASMVSILASALGVAFGGPSVKAASIIGLGATVASGAASTLKAWDNVKDIQAAQENNMAAKLAQLQSQAASTSGTDDIDLMSYYNGNRLHFMVYESSEAMKDSLFWAMFLTGYKSVDVGTPSVDTRYWFNFIQCDPVLDLSAEGRRAFKTEWVEKLKELYNAGVTVFHNHGSSWNFERDKENYETWIVTGVS